MTDRHLHTWRARIGSGDRITGAGTVVAPGMILTCAHVVAAALDTPADGPAPMGSLTVDFPGSARRSGVSAAVHPGSWVPVDTEQGGDLALLSLSGDAPDDVRPARWRRCGAPQGRRVQAFGHPHGLAGGAWTEGTLVGAGGPWPGWMQFDGRDGTGRAVSAGFSGAGVIDESGYVLGVVVAADRQTDTRVAWLIPMEMVATYLPPVGVLLGEVTGGPAGPPAVARLQELARAVAAVPVMNDRTSRDHVIAALRPAIALNSPRHPTPLIDVYGVLRTCLDHAGGLAELLSIIRAFEPESRSVDRVYRLAEEMGLDSTCPPGASGGG